jgi:hypothetical protein
MKVSCSLGVLGRPQEALVAKLTGEHHATALQAGDGGIGG